MTKQEEIRDGVAEILRSKYSINPFTRHMTWKDINTKNKNAWREAANQILDYEHSQGVVIKVDIKELTEGKQYPYTATEPLIKEHNAVNR